MSFTYISADTDTAYHGLSHPFMHPGMVENCLTGLTTLRRRTSSPSTGAEYNKLFSASADKNLMNCGQENVGVLLLKCVCRPHCYEHFSLFCCGQISPKLFTK
jgi:hypothetical protein